MDEKEEIENMEMEILKNKILKIQKPNFYFSVFQI
jgi:hypothetical protein